MARIPVWIPAEVQEEVQLPGRPGRPQEWGWWEKEKRNSPVFPVEKGVKAGSCLGGGSIGGKMNRKAVSHLHSDVQIALE